MPKNSNGYNSVMVTATDMKAMAKMKYFKGEFKNAISLKSRKM